MHHKKRGIHFKLDMAYKCIKIKYTSKSSIAKVHSISLYSDLKMLMKYSNITYTSTCLSSKYFISGQKIKSTL